MKFLLRTLSVLSLLCALSLQADAQFWLPRKTKAELARIKAENSLLRNHVDSLHTVIEGHLATIDSLSTPAQDETGQEELDLVISDSLMHMWYVMQHTPGGKSYDMDSEHFTSDVPDEVFVQRLNDINSFIPIPFNDVVKNYCILYSEKMHSKLSVVLGNSRYYWPIFDEILSHYGLPLELKSLVIVESMMDPTATSRMGAKGLWQFMYQTAKGYGMHIDSFMDERMDPVKSTIAAARYLSDAYKMYNDWALAIASYNCGAGNVNKAIRRSGGKRDFWAIYDYLPRETRGYVPAFVGVLYATHYYREYGIQPAPSAIAVPVDTFMINRNLHFDQLENVVGVPGDLVRNLNPMYMHKIIPGDTRPCVLRLPMQYSNAFIDAGDSLYMYRRDTLLDPVQLKKVRDGVTGDGTRMVYKVKSGDVLGRIANRYGVTVAQIKKWNSLKSNNIRVGQNLIIYRRR